MLLRSGISGLVRHFFWKWWRRRLTSLNFLDDSSEPWLRSGCHLRACHCYQHGMKMNFWYLLLFCKLSLSRLR